MVEVKSKRVVPHEVKEFFSAFAEDYDSVAFRSTAGLRYLDELDRRFLESNVSLDNRSNILDIGAGTGRISDTVTNRMENVTAITCMDISRQMLDQAKQKLTGKHLKARFIQADAGKPFPFSNRAFDVVVCLRVIKYIPTWKLTLKEIYRVMKDGGLFVFDVSNLRSLARFAHKANYLLFDIAELKSELEDSGFSIIRTSGGPRMPFPIYKCVRGKASLTFARTIENTLDAILPNAWLSRNVYFVCKKVKR